VFVQTPKADIYVTLLGISLGAMVLGCLLMILLLGRYGFSTKVSALTPAPASIEHTARSALALNVAPSKFRC